MFARVPKSVPEPAPDPDGARWDELGGGGAKTDASTTGRASSLGTAKPECTVAARRDELGRTGGMFTRIPKSVPGLVPDPGGARRDEQGGGGARKDASTTARVSLPGAAEPEGREQRHAATFARFPTRHTKPTRATAPRLRRSAFAREADPLRLSVPRSPSTSRCSRAGRRQQVSRLRALFHSRQRAAAAICGTPVGTQ